MKLTVKILAVFLVTGLTVLAQSRTVAGEIPDSGKTLKTNPVVEVVKAMTLEEKVFMVIGNKNNYWSEHNFLGVGATYQCDRLGIPPAILDDGPAGLRIPFKRRILAMKVSMIISVTTGRSTLFPLILSSSNTIKRLLVRSSSLSELSRKS